MKKKIIANLNVILTENFTREVEQAFEQMATLKSPGLDSFNPRFYQIYWHIVGNEVTSIILKFLNECCFDSCINFTYIFLIPKIKNSMKFSDFRPITLYNMI